MTICKYSPVDIVCVKHQGVYMEAVCIPVDSARKNLFSETVNT